MKLETIFLYAVEEYKKEHKYTDVEKDIYFTNSTVFIDDKKYPYKLSALNNTVYVWIDDKIKVEKWKKKENLYYPLMRS